MGKKIKIKPKLNKSQWEIIEDESSMGYKDDSPYRNRKSIDIHSENGFIDMSEVGMPILANGQLLPPYSGMHQFEPGVIKEERIMQSGGRTPIVVNDPKDKRLQAYQDSTNAYNSSINRLKLLEKYAYDKNGNDRWIMEDEIKDVNKSNPKYKPKFKNSGYDPISFNITSNNSSGDTETESVEFKYKKPVQPVVYKPKEENVDFPIMYTDRIGNRGGRTFIERVPVGEIDTERLSIELDEILNADKIRPKEQITSLPQLQQELFQETPQQQLETNPYEKGSYFTIEEGQGKRNPETGNFEKQTYLIDKKTGKKLTQPKFPNGGNIKGGIMAERKGLVKYTDPNDPRVNQTKQFLQDYKQAKSPQVPQKQGDSTVINPKVNDSVGNLNYSTLQGNQKYILPPQNPFYGNGMDTLYLPGNQQQIQRTNPTYLNFEFGGNIETESEWEIIED